MNWIKISDRLPKESGQYKVKNGTGAEYVDFYALNASGKRVWITEQVGLVKITEWQEKPVCSKTEPTNLISPGR